jgi:predicted NAD/FAD-binding protein
VVHRQIPRVAVIGGGIAGLAAARTLGDRARVTLIEKAPQLGGHAHTVTVPTPRGDLALDCGFLVFNRARYPMFSGLLDELGISSRASDMAFGVWSDDGSIAFSTSSLGSLYARRRSLLSVRHHRLVAAIGGFLVRGRRDLAAGRADGLSIGDYLERTGASRSLRDHFVRPIAGALWSIDDADIDGFPAEVLLEFLRAHGMLRPAFPPRWRTVAGGSRSYVRALAATLDAEILTGTEVGRIHRDHGGVGVELRGGHSIAVDRVVIAAHTDQALALLAADAPERDALAAIRYSHHRVAVHTDSSRLPPQPRARASWSYRLCRSGEVEVSYWLNRLQKIRSTTNYLVTLDPKTPIPAAALVYETRMSHPLFDLPALAARRRLARLQGVDGTYYAGAYFGFGFHEDGLRSGVAAASRLLADWSRDRVSEAAA